MSWFTNPAHQPFVFPGGGTTGALLLHGFMGSPAELRPLGQALSAAGIEARGIALPGFGTDISRLGAVGMRDWIGAARTAWDELCARYEQTVLLGFSMGGARATHLAAAAEAKPDRLILLAPLSRLRDPRVLLLPLARHVVSDFKPFAGADFDDPRTRAYFAESMPGLDLDDPAAQNYLRTEAVIPLSTLDELRKLVAGVTRQALRVSMPTLVIQGFSDTVVRHEDTRLLAADLAGTIALREVEGKHMIVRDDGPSWQQVCDLVVEFARGDRS